MESRNRTATELKQAAFAAIDGCAPRLIAFGRDILAHPELGYRETRTAGRVLQAFEDMGLAEITRPARTGVKGWLLRGGGPRIAVIGELDAVLSPGHPFADPATGAAHACGHNAQLAAMLGCGVGLRAVAGALAGSVCLIAAPAEEYIEIGWRAGLRQDGQLQYLGGKQQMIAEGAFDDIDMAMMVHSETNAPRPRAVVGGGAGGFIGKELRFIGREAHAGGAPWEGVNALNAAALAISAIHANRETFRDEDHVRVHPIVTKGGDLVNTVPADVRMESYVRAAGIDAMCSANAKVNRAARGAAYAVGAQVEIRDLPGYLPLAPDAKLAECLRENAAAMMGEKNVFSGVHSAGSTDMGDVSQIMPTVHPWVGCVKGTLHGADYVVDNEEVAYVKCPQALACMIVDLLWDDAEKADEICREFKPVFTKETYCQFLEDLSAGKN